MSETKQFKQGALTYAVYLAIQEDDGPTTRDICNTLDESMNLVSGTLDHLLRKGSVFRRKEKQDASFRYYLKDPNLKLNPSGYKENT